MDFLAIFYSTTILFALFFSWNFYFYYKNRYDLNALNRSHYLMINQLIFLAIHTHCSITLVYLDMSEIYEKAISILFIVSHSGFFVVYFLFVYRIILLNNIEFGLLSSDQYSKTLKKLTWQWNFKVSSIYIVVFSSVLIFFFYYFAGTSSVIKALDFGSQSPRRLIFSLFFFFVGYIEYFCYVYLFYKVLRGKYRLTIKIEVIVDLLIWTTYYTYRYHISYIHSYGFSILIRNFSISFILILTFTLRSHFNRIPFPPIENFSLLFVFENRTIYESFHYYLCNYKNEHAVKILELGLYITMNKFQPEKKLANAINFSCYSIQGFKEKFYTLEDVELKVFDELFSLYSDFLDSDNFEELRKKSILLNHLLMF